MKDHLKSSWNNLESCQHVGRVPRRGVLKPASRQRRAVLIGTISISAANDYEKYEQQGRRPNVYDY
jgi:hypothetical protein